MATETNVLGLTKPDYTENGDVGVINANMDVIENAIISRGRTINMLVNSNFLHVVNLRKKTSHTGTGYGIDMWRTNFSGDTVSIVDGGVKNTGNSATNGWHLHQIVHVKKWGLAGERVTVVANVKEFLSSGLRLVCSFRDANDTEISNVNTTLKNGLVVVSGTVPANATRLRVGIYAYAGTIVGDYITMKNIALYKWAYNADNAPAYLENKYADEMMECMRFYQRRSTSTVKPVDMRPLMAGTPTVTAVDGEYAYEVDPNEVDE